MGTILQRGARIALLPFEIWVDFWRWCAEITDESELGIAACTLLRLLWCGVSLVLIPWLIICPAFGW